MRDVNYVLSHISRIGYPDVLKYQGEIPTLNKDTKPTRSVMGEEFKGVLIEMKISYILFFIVLFLINFLPFKNMWCTQIGWPSAHVFSPIFGDFHHILFNVTRVICWHITRQKTTSDIAVRVYFRYASKAGLTGCFLRFVRRISTASHGSSVLWSWQNTMVLSQIVPLRTGEIFWFFLFSQFIL